MSKGLHDVVKNGTDLKLITGAIAAAINTSDVEDNLRGLGFDVQVSEIDWNSFATIRIEGGENETGVILTLHLSEIEIGYDILTIEAPQDGGE